MCGIAGYISEKKPTKKIIKAMTDRIEHRGPDGEGFYLDDNIALGHRRLAIIDLETGDQPIYNEEKDVVVILNGEIYNYQKILWGTIQRKTLATIGGDSRSLCG